MVTQYEVVWTKASQKQLKLLFDYVSSDSPQNALKLIEDIAGAVNKAINNPEIYPSDKYKINNDAVIGLLKNIITEFPTGSQKT